MPKIDIIEMHMAAAHFPIAFLMTSVVLDAAGYFFKKPEWRITSYWIHLLGVLGAVATLALGFIGNPFRDDVGWIAIPWNDYGTVMANKAVTHQWFGLVSFVVFGLLAIWRVKRRDVFTTTELRVFWAASLVGVFLIGVAGYLGAHVMD
jgi:uncharacterized membrane protein